jgi:hypothetical protein
MRGGGALAGGNEMFWAFQGTRTGDTATPDTFISVIGNEADGNYNRSSELSGTGLTTANGALIIDGDEDYMEWTADGLLPDPAVKADLQASILNRSNWSTDDGGGNNNPHGTGFDVSTPTVVCFMRGTLIETPLGARPVEALSKGDLVLTRDNAAQVLKMLCSTRVVPAATIFGQHLSPVCVTQGSLGLGLPKWDLWVSQQHRILVRSAIANRMFGAPEVLIAAVKLTPLPGIFVDRRLREIKYFHLLMGCHEIVIAEGTDCESLYTGLEAIKSLNPDAQNELNALFPDIETMSENTRPARYIPAGKLQKKLVSRHAVNEKPLLNV